MQTMTNKMPVRLLKLGRKLWMEARRKFPDDKIAAGAWFEEQFDRIPQHEFTPYEQAHICNAFLQRLWNAVSDAVEMFPDNKAKAVEWALETLGWDGDEEVRAAVIRAVDFVYDE